MGKKTRIIKRTLAKKGTRKYRKLFGKSIVHISIERDREAIRLRMRLEKMFKSE